MFASSKYRHTKGAVAKRELWYTELSPSVTSDAQTVAVSATTLAVTLSTGSGGDVGLLPLDAVGKRKNKQVSVLHAHPGRQTFDIAFSPLHETVLGTCGDDGNVNVWRLEGAGGPATAAHSLQGHKRRVEVFRFHPAADGVLASGSLDKTAVVWDYAAAKAVQELAHGGGVEGLSWSHDGRLLASTAGDKKVRVWDARSGQCTGTADAHAGVKAQRVQWLGATGKLFTTGQSKFREREFCIWDVKDLSKPLKRHRIDSGTGTLSSAYDPDTNIVFVCGKGDSVVRLYEMKDDRNHFSELQTVTHNQGFKSITLLPKRACDVMECEVDRLFGVLGDSVVPISFVVPRKSHINFADDLFPDTAAPEPALDAAAWFGGADASPRTMSLEPNKFVVKREEKKKEEKKKEEEAKAAEYVPKVKTGIVRKTNYRHTAGKEDWKKTWFTQVKADCATRDATPIAANDRFFAVPWAGPGGRMAVIPLDRPGKLPDNGGFGMLETGSPVLDFCFHPHQKDLLFTGNENAHIMLWRASEDLMDLKDERGRPKNYAGDPVLDLRGHYSKVNFLNHHPTARDVLVSSSADGTVKLWDVNQGAERLTLEGAIEDFVQHVDWSYDGATMMMSCHDCKIKLVDPRAKKVQAEVKTHTGAQGVKLAWLGNSDRVLTTGFGKGSQRELGLWDIKKLSEPLAPFKSVDQAQALMTPHYEADHGIVFLFAKGDGTIAYFEVTEDPPFFHYLSKYPTNVPQMGVAVLPKSTCDVKNVEICRMLKLTVDTVLPVSFTVPRTKKDFFQDDIFSDGWDGQAVMAADEWYNGAAKPRNTVSRCPAGMKPVSQAPKEQKVAKYRFDPNAPKKEDGNYLNSYFDKMVSFKNEGAETAEINEKKRVDQFNVAEDEMEWDEDDWDEAY
eukprot:CAMPEP_0119131958 /NCGR_PEP_ID=MMETSP1310-20130426/11011_1 /TAXON_ID=464262 /ORGANISM="Genus nov. species nov., Strain RCC2339" /LENGTH=899 /DNA_ID=CAMNT_0007122561 /DNA_START=122 /DNA_END=2821 /DNA_ORIENTATION=+